MSNLNNENIKELQNNQDSFRESIKLNQDKEKLRLMEIKRKYDCGEISEDEISNDDIKKIIELYNEEIQSIRSSTRNIKNEIKKELDDLLDTLEDYYGQKPIIYTTITAYWKYLYLGYSKYPLWMRNTYTEPTQKWTFWQYSDKGHLDGCYDGDQQYIDLNVYNGSIEDFRKEFSLEVKG